MDARAVDVLRENVRGLMRASGLSENALANAIKVACPGLSVDQKTINNLMRGGADHNVRVRTIEAVAKWALLPPWALLVTVPDVRALRRLAEVVSKLADQPEADVDVVLTIVRRTDQLSRHAVGHDAVDEKSGDQAR